MEHDLITPFIQMMKSEHNKRGAKLGKYYLEDMEVDEAWEMWATTVQNALTGKTPQELMRGMVNVANTAMYVHNMLEREDSKSVVRKLAEERKKRMDTLDVRRVDR